MRIRLSFLRKNDYIYTFSSLSTVLNFKSYDPTFEGVVRSFKDLRDPRYLNRQPLRLKLVRADGSQTLEYIFRQAGMKKEGWPQAAILNGMEPAGTPAKNQWVKTVK